MAKKRGKKKSNNEEKIVAAPPNSNIKKKPKVKRKRRKASNPNPASAVPHTDAATSGPAIRNDEEPSRGIEKEKGIQKQLSGFIFMCNPTTKLECFQYRVFGLPKGQREVVEEIKPGAKLFLYDFELKLLYGVYEATSSGQLNLEPGAFGGKYPAQVKFKIFKECLPLSEKSLKQVIKENYKGYKFKQELCLEQVKKLSSSFQPLAAPSSLVSRAPQNASQLWTMPPPARGNQINHSAPAGPASVQSAHEVRYVHAASAGPYSIQNAHQAQYVHAQLGPTTVLSAHEAQYAAPPLQHTPVQIAHDARYIQAALQGSGPIQSTHALQHHHDRSASGVAQVHITPGHQNLPITGIRYVPDSQRQYFIESSAREVHQPYLRAREERAQPDAIIPGRQFHQLPLQREPLYRDSAAGYNPYRHAAATRYSSNLQLAQAPSAPSSVQPQPLGLLHYYSRNQTTR